jgi:hypothetical protein
MMEGGIEETEATKGSTEQVTNAPLSTERCLEALGKTSAQAVTLFFNCRVGIEPATWWHAIINSNNKGSEECPVELQADLRLIIDPGTQQFVPRRAH